MKAGPSRLRLLLGTLALVGATVPTSVSVSQATPNVRASTRVETYVDSDRTTVVRPRVSIDARASERFRLAASYMADAISSASIDVVTRASRPIRENRHDATASLTYTGPEDRKTTFSYGFGHEPDYLANSGSITHARNLDEQRLTYLTVRASFAYGRVGTVIDPEFERHVMTSTASASLSRVLDVDRLIRASVELAAVNGFQSSAYRTVRMGDWSAYRYTGTDPAAGEWVFVGVTQSARENHPDARYRARLALELLQAFARHGALDVTVSVYRDSWAMTAGEAAAELRWEPRSALLFRAGGRAYLQSPTWFWRRRYANTTDTRGYLTDDKELGPMRSYAVYGLADVPIGPVHVQGRVELDFYRYPEFTLLPEKRAFVGTLGLTYQR